MREIIEAGDAPEVVADTVVKAASAVLPRRRYTVGKAAQRVRCMRRFLPESFVDKGASAIQPASCLSPYRGNLDASGLAAAERKAGRAATGPSRPHPVETIGMRILKRSSVFALIAAAALISSAAWADNASPVGLWRNVDDASGSRGR